MPTFLDLAGLLIALAALAIAVWSGVESRKHNRQSTRPNLSFLDSYAEGLDFIGLRVVNNGVSPAFISRFVVQTPNNRQDVTSVVGWIDSLKAVRLQKNWINSDPIEVGNVIGVGERLELIHYSEKQADREKIAELARGMKNLYMEVWYKSVYEDEYVLIWDGKKKLGSVRIAN
jgi:hypothetical protein